MPTSSPHPTPVKAIGLLDLTAMAVNGVIGSGIFILPATAALLLGSASPLGFIFMGVVVSLIVLCFAEAGSRFEQTGGPYVYARQAFGPLVGFEVGWMFMLARLTAVAAISNALTTYLGFFWPPAAYGVARVAVLTLVIGGLALVNILGVRLGAWVVDLFTVGKLAPLLLFIMVGLWSLDFSSFPRPALPTSLGNLSQAALVLLFAYGGFEFASVPSEEVIQTRRNLPIALLLGMAIVTVVYVLIQIVAVGTLPDLAHAERPLAQASQRFLGPLGAGIIAAGAILSTTGTNSASVLVGPRMLYALAENRDLPSPLGRLHPRFRTPYLAILVFAGLALPIAAYGRFVELAAMSAIARLVPYITTCLAVPVLRRQEAPGPHTFRLPGGPTIPALAVLLSGWVLTGSTGFQAIMGLTALLVGALLFGFTRLVRAKQLTQSP